MIKLNKWILTNGGLSNKSCNVGRCGSIASMVDWTTGGVFESGESPPEAMLSLCSVPL